MTPPPGKDVQDTPRWAAVDILCRWYGRREAIDPLLAQTAAGLKNRDRALVMELVYGVLRQLEHLDRVIGLLSSHPLRKMKLRTLMVLRVGLYQLQFCDRIPPSAAVNETVAVLRRSRQPRWLTGFANGLLRNASRNLAALPRPDDPDQDGLPVLNHPSWLTDRWRQRYGDELALRICRTNNQPAGLTLCCNRRLSTRDGLLALFEQAGVRARPGDLDPAAVLLERDAGPVSSLPGYSRGLFHVQDQAAQLASRLLLAPDADMRLLDGCAGVGGKTLFLAQHLGRRCSLAAIEPDPRRYGLLQENLHRLGLDKVVRHRCMSLDEHALNTATRYDGIFIDAPCSGTGVIRRHPDIRWNRCPEDLMRNQQTQLRLLAGAAALLTPGGALVYATCSIEPEENEEVAARFLAEHPDFAVVDAAPLLPGQARPLVNADGMFAPLPGTTVDGFFAVRFEHRGSL